MKLNWDMEYAVEILPELLGALKITIGATILGMTLALAGGLILALLRRSRLKLVSMPAVWIIEFIRSTPLLVQIYFLFYVFPEFGVKLNPFATGIFALGLHYSSYTSEVYRAGINAVPAGQWEAAVALNLSPWTCFSKVILPQSIPPVVPALGNYLIAMFKDTPMLSTITVLELVYTARDLGSQSFRYLEPLTLVGAIFLIISLIAAALIRRLERALALPGS